MSNILEVLGSFIGSQDKSKHPGFFGGLFRISLLIFVLLILFGLILRSSTGNELSDDVAFYFVIGFVSMIVYMFIYLLIKTKREDKATHNFTKHEDERGAS